MGTVLGISGDGGLCMSRSHDLSEEGHGHRAMVVEEPGFLGLQQCLWLLLSTLGSDFGPLRGHSECPAQCCLPAFPQDFSSSSGPPPDTHLVNITSVMDKLLALSPNPTWVFPPTVVWNLFPKTVLKEELRWRRSRMGRTLSPPQIHQKNI